LTSDPIPRHSVQKDGRFARREEVTDPGAPSIGEPSAAQDFRQAVPIDRVEGFVKIKFEDDGRGVPFVAAVKEVSGVGEALGNAPPKDKASLITADKRRNDGLKRLVRTLERALTMQF